MEGFRKFCAGVSQRSLAWMNSPSPDTGKTLMETEAYAASGIERKKIETLFGEAKHILALTRLRLCGLSGARDEFLLTASVQNL